MDSPSSEQRIRAQSQSQGMFKALVLSSFVLQNNYLLFASLLFFSCCRSFVQDHDLGKKNDLMGMASLDLNKGGFNETPVRIAVELKDKKTKKKNLGFLKLIIAIKTGPPPLQSSHKFSQSATEVLFRCLIQKNYKDLHEFFKSPMSSEANYNCVCAAKRLRGTEGMTPLMMALSHEDPALRLQTVHLLLEKGATVAYRVEGTSSPRLDQLTPVYYAASLGLPAEIGALLAASSELSSPDHPTHCLLDGMSPLMGAIYWNHPKTMAFLLSKGASPNHRNETGVTPIMLVAHHNRGMDFIESLVAAGADINARSQNGSTPLYEFARVGNLKAVEFLLAQGATNFAHSSGLTPLLAALTKGHTAVAQALIPSTARDKLLDVFVHHTNAQGTVKVNALALAALLLKKALVRVLIENGASVEGSMFIRSHDAARQTTKTIGTILEGLGFGEYLPRAPRPDEP